MEQENKITSYERERAVEIKEDVELSEEAKVAAARERAEYLTKEVVKGTQQIQNIMLNMQQVLQALATVRASLELPSVSDDPTSIAEDKKRVAQLKEKIKAYQNELVGMKQELGHLYEENSKNHLGEDIQIQRQVEDLMNNVEKILENHS